MCLVKVYSEEFGEVFTNDFEIIKESDSDFVEDGDGFEINMNGIDYKDYIENPNNYKIEKRKTNFKIGDTMIKVLS